MVLRELQGLRSESLPWQSARSEPRVQQVLMATASRGRFQKPDQLGKAVPRTISGKKARENERSLMFPHSGVVEPDFPSGRLV